MILYDTDIKYPERGLHSCLSCYPCETPLGERVVATVPSCSYQRRLFNQSALQFVHSNCLYPFLKRFPWQGLNTHSALLPLIWLPTRRCQCLVESCRGRYNFSIRPRRYTAFRPQDAKPMSFDSAGSYHNALFSALPADGTASTTFDFLRSTAIFA